MQQTLTLIDINEIFESPTNPRKTFNETSLEELAESLKSKGVLQPIVVRPRPEGGYEVVAGARRTRAARIAQRTDMPCLVKDYSDDEVLEIQIIENSQREDVDPLEEAYGYHALITRGIYDAEAIAVKVSKSVATVHRRLALTRLDEEVTKKLVRFGVPLASMELIATLPEVEQQNEAADWWNPDKYGYGEQRNSKTFRAKFSQLFLSWLDTAPFDLEDTTLNPEMGSCTTCPFNSASPTTLFHEEVTSPVCTKVSCFKIKSEVSFDRKCEEATSRGLTLLSQVYGRSDLPGVLKRDKWRLAGNSEESEKGVVVECYNQADLFTEVSFIRYTETSSDGDKAKPNMSERKETLRRIKAEMIARRTIFDEVLRQYDADPVETTEALTTPEFWRALAVSIVLNKGAEILSSKDPVNGKHPGHDFRAEEFGLPKNSYWYNFKLKNIKKVSDDFNLAVRTLFIHATAAEIHVNDGESREPFVLMAAVDSLKLDLEHIRKEADWSTLSKKAQKERQLLAKKEETVESKEEKLAKTVKKLREVTGNQKPSDKPKRTRKKKGDEQPSEVTTSNSDESAS